MNLGLVELRRKPGRFTAAPGALVLISLLVLFLGGLLDGLFLGSTGVLRAQPGELVTFGADSRLSVIRSRITPEVRQAVAGVPGVAETGGLGLALVGATPPGSTEALSVAVVGYELAPAGMAPPPPPGEGWADRSLEGKGVRVGDVLAVGITKVPVRVAGWVDDTSFLLQPGLWTAPDTWRTVLAGSRPDQNLAPGTFQALTVRVTPGSDAATVATAVDAATASATRTITREEAVLALPGVKEQQSTFTAVIGVTLAVAGLVVALFFALLTLERAGMYAVFKAIGASTGQVFAGVLAQAVAIAAVSFAAGVALVFGARAGIGDAVPLTLVPGRIVTTGLALAVTACVGAVASLRRLTRIDPATAIG